MSQNTSSFSSNTIFIDGDSGGSRLLVQIPSASCTGGVTAGDVIHYDALNSFYIKSIANNPPNSEVFGIIESTNIDASFNVVTYGSIVLPSSSIEDVPAGSTGAGGGSDIYFLSPDTSGKVRNTIPSELNRIVKPIYQVAPHGEYTGIVMNYIGYKVPNEITVFTPQERSLPVGSVEHFLTTPNAPQPLSPNYVSMVGGDGVPIDNTNGEYDEFIQKYNYTTYFSFRWEPIGNVSLGGVVYPLWDTQTVINNYGGQLIFTNIGVFHDGDSITLPIFEVIIVDFENKTCDILQPLFVFGSQAPPDLFTNIQNSDVRYIFRNTSSGVPPQGSGGIIVTEITVNDRLFLAPSVGSSFRTCSFSDQNNNSISSGIMDDWIIPIVKLRAQSASNTISTLESNSANTQNFNLDGDDLITTLTDLESRIATAEQEINK